MSASKLENYEQGQNCFDHESGVLKVLCHTDK
ncbi:hypothetical protein NC651_011734 [Populus alba x Populus x berolinensis]|nr:hypothetical protein NC651_011734 [Populus alba x Populus x berolinensis]